jgi:flagellar assembly protein FliH
MMPGWLKMKWSESITLRQPLRDVRLLTPAPAPDWPALLREREQAAYERGRRDGELARNEQAAREAGHAVAQWNQLVESLRQTVPQVIRETENTLLHLALEAAQKVVGGLPITAEMVEAVVREAVQQAENTADITIQLHPEDLALLRSRPSTLLNGPTDTGPLKFAAASEVTRGGCLVRTRFGVIDARRETKLEQLRQTLAV